MRLFAIIFLFIPFLSSSYAGQIKLSGPKETNILFNRRSPIVPCDSLAEVNRNELIWSHSGTAPWFAEADTKVYRSSEMTELINLLKQEQVPGLTNSFAEVFKTFQDAGCLLYIHGGAIRDFLLGLSPKDIDQECR